MKVAVSPAITRSIVVVVVMVSGGCQGHNDFLSCWRQAEASKKSISRQAKVVLWNVRLGLMGMAPCEGGRDIHGPGCCHAHNILGRTRHAVSTTSGLACGPTEQVPRSTHTDASCRWHSETAVKLEVGDPAGLGCGVTAAPAGVAAARTSLTSPPPGALQYLGNVSQGEKVEGGREDKHVVAIVSMAAGVG